MHDYSNLQVWRRSIALCREVYRLTGSFPDDERFGLTTQMRRAAVSIPSNIAEGAAFHTSAAFKRYLRIALGSAYELYTQLVISSDVGYVQRQVLEPVRSELEEVRAMIVGLYRSAATQES